MSPAVRIRPSAVALVSMVQLAFEMMVVKLGRYELGSLAIGTIGLAVLGVSLSSPLAGWLGGGRRAIDRALALLLPVATLVGAYFVSRPHEFHDVTQSTLAMLVCGGAAALVMALSSVPIFVALRADPAEVGTTYTASLVGATFGVPSVLAAMHFVGDIGAYAFVVFASGIAAAAFATERRRGLVMIVASTLAAAACLVVFPRLDRAAHPGVARIETDATSRIDVYRRPGGRLQFRTAGVNAGTTTAGGSVDAPREGLTSELSASAFALQPRTALVLGSGAGKNVVQGLSAGVERIVAVEINPMIPRALAEMLPPTHDPYRDPRVELVVGEGREVAAALAREGHRFDLVYVPIATLFGSSGHAFTETYLMTREAFVHYADALARGGTIAVFFPDLVRSKVVYAMGGALRARGVRDPAAHLVVVRRGGSFLALARFDAPIGDAERLRIAAGSEAPLDARVELARARSLRALEDDNPFLYNDIGSARGMRALYGWNLRFLREAYLVTLAALAAFALLTWLRRLPAARAERAGAFAAFATMGIAYTAHQTLVLQRLAFLVGHPVTATAIVLPMTLLGSAIGARLSSRIPSQRIGAFRLACFALLVVGTAPLVTLAPTSLVLIGWPSVVRIGLASLLAAAPFVALGTYFPIAFARLERATPELASPAWLANGFGAVLGSFAAIYAPMLFGFHATAFVTFAAYAMLSVWDVAVERGLRGAHLVLALALLVALAVGTVALERAFAPVRAPHGSVALVLRTDGARRDGCARRPDLRCALRYAGASDRPRAVGGAPWRAGT